MDNLAPPDKKTVKKPNSGMSKGKNVSSVSQKTYESAGGTLRKNKRANGEETIIVRTENNIIMTGLNELYAKTD
jgi:hypothetical protein